MDTSCPKIFVRSDTETEITMEHTGGERKKQTLVSDLLMPVSLLLCLPKSPDFA